MPHARFNVTYWGTRGSYPRVQTAESESRLLVQLIEELRNEGLLDQLRSPETSVLELVERSRPDDRFGNHTCCIEIRYGDFTYLVDAGSGIQAWAHRQSAAALQNTFILVTHAHMDHICGLPFVDQLYRPENRIEILAPGTVSDTLRRIVGTQGELQSALIPISVDQMKGVSALTELEGEPIQLGEVTVDSFKLNHPGGAYAYRFDAAGQSVVIATDHEPTSVPDEALAEFAREADLLYIDGQYTQLEYDGQASIGQGRKQSRHGWGHGSIESCLQTGLAARVAHLHIGHHDPARSDKQLYELELAALDRLSRLVPDANARPSLRFAREGDELTLTKNR